MLFNRGQVDHAKHGTVPSAFSLYTPDKQSNLANVFAVEIVLVVLYVFSYSF